jgi:6-pyruvoyltetrahydropterin/6-carboxytetrahydropterin synthase
MITDFGNLKVYLTEYVHDLFDHGMIVWQEDKNLLKAMQVDPDWKVIVFPYIPTAENMARWIWEELERVFETKKEPFTLSQVTVYETPTSVVRYIR